MKNLKETPKVVKETVGSGKPFEQKAKGVAKVEEDVKITDTVGKGDPFDKNAKGAKKIDEEREKDFMADIEGQTPNQGKGEAEKGRIYNEKIVGPTSGKPMPNTKKGVSENFNLSGLNQTGANQSLDSAQPMDELLTMEQIEEEIANMGNMAEELGGVHASAQPQQGQDQGGQEGGIAYNELVEMRDKLNKMIGDSGMAEQKNNGGRGANKINAGGPTQPMIDERDEVPPQDPAFPATKMKTGKTPNNNIYRGNEPKSVDEMHQGNFTTANINKMHQGDYDASLIDEYGNSMEITEEDINSVLGNGENPVEESHGLTNRKNITGRHTPAPEYLSTGEKTRLPYALQQNESTKKISSLIEENKKLTKKLNEAKKDKETKSKLVEGYQTVIGKYRSQLKEMAVFNTNLSHVNNLLVNEELALTQEDKVKIINEFKKVDSITSSVNVYKNLMTEMKVGKKTLTESFENKVSASIQPSSKQKLDEVKEKTAYTNVPRMKALIESMEKRGKKII